MLTAAAHEYTVIVSLTVLMCMPLHFHLWAPDAEHAYQKSLADAEPRLTCFWSASKDRQRVRIMHCSRVCSPKSELKAPTLSVLGFSGTAAIAAAVFRSPLAIEAPT